MGGAFFKNGGKNAWLNKKTYIYLFIYNKDEIADGGFLKKFV